MKILVTGGGGFLGGAIVEKLAARGEDVRSFSRGLYPRLDELGVEQLQGDLGDRSAVIEACRGCGLVFHVAAKAGIWGHSADFYRANVLGTENILEACRQLGIPRLVYTSSPSVVFDGSDMEGANESVPYPDRYKADYPRTKAMAEKKVLASVSAEFSAVALRPHLIWGPRDTGLIPGILARGRNGNIRRVGKQRKLVDCTYIDNVVEAHLKAADALFPGSVLSGKVYFISQDEPLDIWDFIARVLECAGLPPIKGEVSPAVAYAAGAACEKIYRWFPSLGEPPVTRFAAEELATSHWFDNSAARRDFGYRPVVSMEEGFRRLEEWIREQQGTDFQD